MAPGYRSFALARVIGFTPKKVRVTYRNTWNYSGVGEKGELLQGGSQLVRVDGPELTRFLLASEG